MLPAFDRCRSAAHVERLFNAEPAQNPFQQDDEDRSLILAFVTGSPDAEAVGQRLIAEAKSDWRRTQRANLLAALRSVRGT